MERISTKEQRDAKINSIRARISNLKRLQQKNRDFPILNQKVSSRSTSSSKTPDKIQMEIQKSREKISNNHEVSYI